MGVAQFAPHGAHYHANVIYSKKEESRVLMLRCVRLTPARFRDQPSIYRGGQHTLTFYTKFGKANSCKWQACDTSQAIAKRVLKRNLELLSRFPSKGQTDLLTRRFGIILTRVLLVFSLNMSTLEH